jgi:hypothetical protein
VSFPRAASLLLSGSGWRQPRYGHFFIEPSLRPRQKIIGLQWNEDGCTPDGSRVRIPEIEVAG